jgi:hypothetical protein
MTGPAYPRPPGVFNVSDTIISQYANSPIMTSILTSFSEAIDPTADFDLFYQNVWNIDTASGPGLDLWGRIIGVNRLLPLATSSYFGFAESGSVGFGNGPFYSGQTLTQNYYLSDDAYRLLLLIKAATNITDGSIKATNAALMALFPGRGNAYVQETLTSAPYFQFGESPTSTGFGTNPFYLGSTIELMKIKFMFDFQLQDFEIAIIEQSGVIPRPTGVGITVVITPYALLVPSGSSSFVTSDGYTINVRI